MVLTVYDSKDWIGDFLEPAVKIEKSGKPGVFYTDPEKAGKYRALSLGKKGQVLSGFTGHTIQDIGINVKSQNETLQFKSWFGDSKVVDESGKPLEVYHGTNWDGWEFDTENGAFFSEKEDYAEEMAAQRGGSRIVKAYLSIRNPLVVEVPGNKMADPEFEARIIAEAKSKGHDGVKLETDTDNEIAKDVFWVAFEPNQIKSATDNVGTFDPGNPDVRFSVAPDAELELDRVNQAFNNELQKQIDGELPKGYLYQLGRPGSILRSTGIPDLPIEMSATRLAEKAETAHHPFNIEDMKDLPLYLNKPIGVFEYGNKDKAQNIVVEIQKEDKHFIVGLSLNFKHDGLVVNSIHGLYPKDTHEWLTWIQNNKALYLNKEKVQALIDQQRRNPADVNYLDLDLISKIVRDFQNASGEFENSSRNSVSPEADVTETAPFKNWFGDSKVVDESGKPLEVYHGTNWDGWEFDTENGAFFSEKEDYAEEMAAQRGGSRIVKAYLSIRNPLVVEVPGNKMADPEFEARIIAEAKSKGHDGVKLETDTDNEIEKDVFWVAFEPNQIKSATDNVGTFDPGNNDVRFSVAPDEELELVQGNSNSESGMRDAELELVRGGSEMAADESGKYFPAPDEWGTAYTSMTGKGLQAIMFLLEKKDGFVPAAFNRPEIGDIDIVYGKTGFGIDDEGGYGLAHIEKRRGKGHVDWGIFANTLTNGTYVPKNKSTVYFVNKKSKVIVKLSFKEFKRKWVVSAMGNDLTFAADRLLASNPGEAAKQGVAPKGLYTIGDVFDKIKLTSNEKSEKTSEKINGGTDEYGDGVRSSLINLDLTEDERSLVNIMKVLVSGQFNPDFDYAQRVKDVYGRYELQAEDGAMLKVIVDFNRKKDKNRSVMNFYSDRESDPRGQASSGGITDLSNNLPLTAENASGGTGKTSEKINDGTDEYVDGNSRLSVAPDDAFVQARAKVLLPVVSTQYINVDGAAAYLMDHGIEVYAGRDDDTLRKACVLAQTWKKNVSRRPAIFLWVMCPCRRKRKRWQKPGNVLSRNGQRKVSRPYIQKRFCL